ncbi:MAG TPA: STM3941 family protein [Steroidobacteraceae bacterium]|nr:STM3941 family protein [Steroidobacteraceae bacterium]
MTDQLVIRTSRKKLAFLCLMSLAFVAAGIWMLTRDDASIHEMRSLNDPLLFHAVGAAVALLFAAGAVLFVRKAFDPLPGLVLSAEGITDNSSGVAAGLIPWPDISGIKVHEIRHNKFVVILLHDNEKYLQRGNAMKRSLNRANCNMVGSPIAISPGTLDIGFVELLEELEKYRKKYAP